MVQKEKGKKKKKKQTKIYKNVRLGVFRGVLAKTSGGLKKDDIVRNKSGRYVGKRRAEISKKHPWIKAVLQARQELKLQGFVKLQKGTEYYKLARKIYDDMKIKKT